MDKETCYAMIDRFLQNNLYSDDYEEYLEALDQLCQPYPRTWVGLTDEDWKEIEDMPDTFDQGVAWAQAKLKDKNG